MCSVAAGLLSEVRQCRASLRDGVYGVDDSSSDHHISNVNFPRKKAVRVEDIPWQNSDWFQVFRSRGDASLRSALVFDPLPLLWPQAGPAPSDPSSANLSGSVEAWTRHLEAILEARSHDRFYASEASGGAGTAANAKKYEVLVQKANAALQRYNQLRAQQKRLRDTNVGAGSGGSSVVAAEERALDALEIRLSKRQDEVHLYESDCPCVRECDCGCDCVCDYEWNVIMVVNVKVFDYYGFDLEVS